MALHGKLEYYTDIMRTLFLELMEQYVVAKNPKLMLRRFVGDSACVNDRWGRVGLTWTDTKPDPTRYYPCSELLHSPSGWLRPLHRGHTVFLLRCALWWGPGAGWVLVL